MESINDILNNLSDDINRIVEQKPHIETLLRAFEPVIRVKYRLAEIIPDKMATLSPDKLKSQGGIPLLKQYTLFFPDDPWQDMTPPITEAIGTGFPHLAADMATLSQNITGGRLNLYDFFCSPSASDEEQINDRARSIGIAPPVLKFFLRVLSRIILTKRAKDMAAEIAALPWDKGYCPVCGSFPMLAVIREKGQRWLVCSQCAHQWSFPRTQCPYCEKESPEKTDFLYIEEEKDNMAFTCDKCRRYLITVNRTESLRETDPDVTAISLAHLDLILQDRNFLPMAESDWTQF